MNDAFVSDCLNCFRPFTAFRRKHHCRFVDKYFVQIAHCLFHITNIEMKGITPRILQKPYNDKLRVCKPCYSDVIIYLSDDSSSANDSDGEKLFQLRK